MCLLFLRLVLALLSYQFARIDLGWCKRNATCIEYKILSVCVSVRERVHVAYIRTLLTLIVFCATNKTNEQFFLEKNLI